MADVTERIEKQIEGTNLALAAVAEVLQKMDLRLSKEEDDAMARAHEDAEEAAKAEIVKSIANEVLSVLKEEMAGLDVSGEDRKARPTGGTPQNADDSESGVEAPVAIEDQQNTIQASLQKEDDDDEDDDEIESGGMAYKQEDDEEEEADDEAADVPIEADEEEDGEDDDEIMAMRKQIATLTKRLESTQVDMKKSISSEAESRLRKMGFREENGLKAPEISGGLGVDDTPIVKASNADGDVATQLSELSYKQLRDLQHKIESGDTDGVPRELLG
tara:strand:+ start:101 stop:925 length:825 start_codon:yes stop_codon:yes gene_type:complete